MRPGGSWSSQRWVLSPGGQGGGPPTPRFEFVYTRHCSGGEAHLAAIVTRDAEHDRGAHEAVLLSRYRLAF